MLKDVLVNNYLQKLNIQNNSKQTISSYISVLNKFIEYIQHNKTNKINECHRWNYTYQYTYIILKNLIQLKKLNDLNH